MERWVFWFEELGKEQSGLVGKKCANLGELTRTGFRVPCGFALSTQGFARFMEITRADREIERCAEKAKKGLDRIGECLDVSAEIREIIESKPMPEEMAREIADRYQELCRRAGRENMPVAVRSSGEVSMPGQMDTYLNIIGAEAVVCHVEKVWSSAFTARAIAFRLSHGLPAAAAAIGVGVMALVDAKSAGVVLTVLPSVGDTTKVVIEGNWGLGESVVGGEITPDSFIVDKASLGIFSRVIAHKSGAVRRGASGTVYQEVEGGLSDKPCLEDLEILEIAGTAVRGEQHFGVPQDMEWVADRALPPGRNIFWLQARPARYTKVKQGDEIDYLIDLMATLFT